MDRHGMDAVALLFLLGVAIAAACLLSDTDDGPVCVDGVCPYAQAGFSGLISAADSVAMDLPASMRQANWGGGSCVHAANVSLLRWAGQYEMADWWKSQYSGGEYSTRMTQRLDTAGLKFAYTKTADMAFLDWASRTRRGAGIFYKPNHSIVCVGTDSEYVYLLDNNDVNRPERTGEYEKIPRAQFAAEWPSHGGFAWALVYTPPPPIPYQ